ncbi:MAG: cation transporter, partial [Ilumatobacteraceae bacterium]
MMKMVLEVPGMSCAHCEAAVKGEVGKVAGVGVVDVDL